MGVTTSQRPACLTPTLALPHRGGGNRFVDTVQRRKLGTTPHSVTPHAQPKFSLATDACFDVEGFRNLLAIRAEMEGQWGGKPPAPAKYYDLSYYDRALKMLAR